MDTINDDGKLRAKINNKKFNAKSEGIDFRLSKEEVISLMNEAGIVSSQWNHKGFHLSRYNDSGAYCAGNCRFVPYCVNYAEKKVSEKSRDASKRNARIMNSEPDHSLKIKDGIRKSSKWVGYINRRKMDQLLNEEKRYCLSHPSYRGDKNSQYGTHWITDGSINKKIKHGDNIPNGFYVGRAINYRHIVKSSLPVVGTGLP